MFLSFNTVEEIWKFTDPLYAELDAFVTEGVKIELLIAGENRLKETMEEFDQLENLKSVLDSQTLQGTRFRFCAFSYYSRLKLTVQQLFQGWKHD